jgi:hypothetical protein
MEETMMALDYAVRVVGLLCISSYVLNRLGAAAILRFWEHPA